MQYLCISSRKPVKCEKVAEPRSFVENAKDYVENHYSNEEVSLDTVCEKRWEYPFSIFLEFSEGNRKILYRLSYRLSNGAGFQAFAGSKRRKAIL